MATTTLDALRRLRQYTATGEARRLRESAGLTIRMAARRCADIDPTALQRWERGASTPRGANLGRYVRLLDRLAALDAAARDGPDAA